MPLQKEKVKFTQNNFGMCKKVNHKKSMWAMNTYTFQSTTKQESDIAELYFLNKDSTDETERAQAQNENYFSL